MLSDLYWAQMRLVFGSALMTEKMMGSARVALLGLLKELLTG